MSAQISLFGKVDAPGGGERPAPRSTRKAAFRKIKDPWGDPDKSGRYWYERELDKLRDAPPPVRELCITLAAFTAQDQTKMVRDFLSRWFRAGHYDRSDFQEAVKG